MDSRRFSAEYVDSGGEQLYVVHHSSRGRSLGGVLLLGPFAPERGYAYAVWRRWAEMLAEVGFDVLRFDYRGVGESTGRFEQMRLSDWIDDAQTCFELLTNRVKGPCLLHGLRFGCLIASRIHARRGGAGLLLWDPPASGARLVRELLRTRLAEDAVLPDGAAPMGRAASSADLRAGRAVGVGGYSISAALWEELEAQPSVALGLRSMVTIALLAGNSSPSRKEEGKIAIRIPSPPFWRPSRILSPNLDELFAVSLEALRGLCAGNIP